MERVAFLIEATGEQIYCLLNPETLVVTRTAGVEARQSSGGRLTGSGLADDPLLFTGGGRTELKLDLLFDIDLLPAHIEAHDVRQLTRRIWALAENSAEVKRQHRPPMVQLLWGQAWSVPGIVTEVAERFDRFATDGSPLRSWLRLTFVRVGAAADKEGGEAWALAQRLPPIDLSAPPATALEVVDEGVPAGGEGAATINPTRLGLFSLEAFGNPFQWKELLAYNGIDDPLDFIGPLAVPFVGEGGALMQVQGLPELIVRLGDRRLAPADTARIISIRVSSALAQPTQCQVSWAADDTLGVDPGTGDALRIEIGGHREPLFVGEVTVVEYSYRADTGRQLRIRAYDALHRLRKRQFTRLLDATDLRGVTEALAADTGLSVEAPSDPVGTVYQVARSDLDQLVEVSSRHGHYPVVWDGTLKLVQVAGEGEPVSVMYGSTLHAAEIEVSAEPAFRSAEATWWDAASTQAGAANVAESGAAALVRADAAPTRTGGGGALLRHDDLREGSAAEPRSLAGAELDVRRLGEVTAVLVAEGNPLLQAGRRIKVEGVRAPVEGTYAITEAVHEISVTGYETTVTSRPPAAPRPRKPDQVTLGVVTDVADPEDRARVRVRLPAYPDLVSGWAPVVLPAAGAGKGVVALPDVDDHVLVLLPGHDPAQAIVLGGLYGTESPPSPPDERGTTTLVRTRDGQQVVLDGKGHVLSLTDGHGSSVELGPSLLRITAATDLLIEAPGRALRVRAKTVDFEEAP